MEPCKEILKMTTHGEIALTKQEVPALPFGYSRHSGSRLSAVIYRSLQNRSRKAHVTSFLILFIAVALLDLGLDQNLSLYSLYLVPALYATWFLGAGWGYVSCALSAVVWLSDDMIQR